MNFHKIITILFLTALVVSCSSEKKFKVQEEKLPLFQNAEFETNEKFDFFKLNKGVAKKVVIHIDDYINSGINISSISDQSSYLVLESRDDVIVGGVDALFLDDGHWFISDIKLAKGVFKFNSTGGFVARIGRNGQGPGEYLNPSNVSVDDGMVFIHSEFQGRIFVFDQEGRFQRELRVPFLFDDFHHLKNRFLFNTFNKTNGHITHIANQMLVSTDNDLTIESAGYYFDPEVFIKMRAGYEDRIVKHANRLYYIQPFDSKLSMIDLNASEITAFIDFDFGEKWPEHEEIKNSIKRNPGYLRQELTDRGYAIIEDFRIGRNHVLLKVLYHGRLISLLISIETGEVTGGIAWIDNLDKLPGIQPAYLIDNKIVSIIEVPYLLEAVAKMDKTSADYHNLLKKIPQLESIRPSDNVVLRIHELN